MLLLIITYLWATLYCKYQDLELMIFNLLLDLDRIAEHRMAKRGMCRDLEESSVRDIENAFGRGEETFVYSILLKKDFLNLSHQILKTCFLKVAGDTNNMNKFMKRNFAWPASFKTLISRLLWVRLSSNFAETYRNDERLRMWSFIW